MRIGLCVALGLPLASCQDENFCIAMKVMLGFCPLGSVAVPAAPSAEATAAAVPGDIIFVGGITSPGITTRNAEIFQAATKKFVATNMTATARTGIQAVGFPSGPLSHHVLVPSGASGTIDDHHTLNFIAFTLTTLFSGEIYDSTSGAFSSSGVLTAPRLFYTATLLKDGTVLVAGGFGGLTPLASAEIYNPATNTFTPTAGAMRSNRALHTATLLPDGKVLIAGGITTNYGKVTDAAELYNPHTKTFTRIPGGMGIAMAAHTAAMISGCDCDADGKVLLAGGFSGTGSIVKSAHEVSHAETVLYSASTKTFSPGPTMQDERVFHTATTLPDGKVLLAGGMSGSVLFGFGDITGDNSHVARALKSAEIYDPQDGQMSCVGGAIGTHCAAIMHNARIGHTAALLTTGPLQDEVLLAASSGNQEAEVFDPADKSFRILTSQMRTQRTFSASTIVP
jgi:hypothetical protein